MAWSICSCASAMAETCTCMHGGPVTRPADTSVHCAHLCWACRSQVTPQAATSTWTAELCAPHSRRTAGRPRSPARSCLRGRWCGAADDVVCALVVRVDAARDLRMHQHLSLWCRCCSWVSLGCSRSGARTQMMGRVSLLAPAMALSTLRPPTARHGRRREPGRRVHGCRRGPPSTPACEGWGGRS